MRASLVVGLAVVGVASALGLFLWVGSERVADAVVNQALAPFVGLVARLLQ